MYSMAVSKMQPCSCSLVPSPALLALADALPEISGCNSCLSPQNLLEAVSKLRPLRNFCYAGDLETGV